MFSFVTKSSTLNATEQFWYSWQSITVASVSWLCNSNTQSKCGSQIHQTTNNSCSSFLTGGATVSTRVEIFKLSCRPPAFVISAILTWLGVFVIGTTFPFIVVSASAPGVLSVPALPRPLLQLEGPWFAQDINSDWNISQRSKWKEFPIKFKILWVTPWCGYLE